VVPDDEELRIVEKHLISTTQRLMNGSLDCISWASAQV
jgi:hypothetical protein